MKWLILALQIFPFVLDAVRAAEAAIAGDGKGNEKLNLLLGIVDVVYDSFAGEVKDLPKEKITNLIIGVINKVVAVFNGLGIFRKTVPTG